MKSTSDATLYNVGFPRLWQMVFGLITFNAQEPVNVRHFQSAEQDTLAAG